MKTVNGSNYEWVRSHYHQKWKGIILDRHPRSKYRDLLTVVIIFDHNNHLMIRRMVKCYDESYFVKIPSIDVEINRDWVSTVLTSIVARNLNLELEYANRK